MIRIDLNQLRFTINFKHVSFRFQKESAHVAIGKILHLLQLVTVRVHYYLNATVAFKQTDSKGYFRQHGLSIIKNNFLAKWMSLLYTTCQN